MGFIFLFFMGFIFLILLDLLGSLGRELLLLLECLGGFLSGELLLLLGSLGSERLSSLGLLGSCFGEPPRGDAFDGLLAVLRLRLRRFTSGPTAASACDVSPW